MAETKQLSVRQIHHRLFELMNDLVIEKTRDGNAFKYAELIDLQQAVDKKIEGTGFFYQFSPFGIEIFHKDFEQPIYSSSMTPEAILSFPEMEKYQKGQNRFQRILSASTYIKRCLMVAAFNLKLNIDYEAQQIEINNSADKEDVAAVADSVYEKYASRLQKLQPSDVQSNMEKTIQEDVRLNDDHKASLLKISQDAFASRDAKQV